MDARPASYEEFWPFYVSQHSKPLTRALHFLGTTCGLGFLLLGLVVSPRFFIAALPAPYALAWAGHFFVEKNRPATFTYPLWSFRADCRMYRLILLGRMGSEVERVSGLHTKTS